MTSDDLVERLVADLKARPPLPVLGRFGLGVGAGMIVSAILMLVWLGPRADLVSAVSTAAFWMKFAYTLGLSLLALAAATRLARPGGRAGTAVPAVGIVVALLAGVALFQLASAVPEARRPLLLGASAARCPFNIVALSLPIFLGALWAMRGLAPTRLALAGAAAGLVAGAAGAWVYAFHCNESAAPFVAIWYTAGIAAVALLGALGGRWLLRW